MEGYAAWVELKPEFYWHICLTYVSLYEGTHMYFLKRSRTRGPFLSPLRYQATGVQRFSRIQPRPTNAREASVRTAEITDAGRPH